MQNQTTNNKELGTGNADKEKAKKETWTNISADDEQEEREVEQAQASAKYEVNPELAKKVFIAKAITRPHFKSEKCYMTIKVHQNWTKEIPFDEADAAYFQVCGMEREYQATIGRLTSRKKGKEGRQYIGVSIQTDDEVMNAPFDMKEFKILEKIGFIRKVKDGGK